MEEPIMTLQDWDDYLSGGLETNDEKQSDDDRKEIYNLSTVKLQS